MEDSQSPTSAAYAVLRSRGKQAGQSLYQVKARAARKARGQEGSSDESESEEDIAR